MKNKHGDLNGIGRTIIALLIAAFAIGVIALAMSVLPRYSVWQRGLKGEAELRQAEWNKQILVREAEAMLEAERLNAQAEVERARGMAMAMEIENGMLTETYIKYLWVRGMANNENIVYIPTEASLPLLEIGR